MPETVAEPDVVTAMLLPVTEPDIVADAAEIDSEEHAPAFTDPNTCSAPLNVRTQAPPSEKESEPELEMVSAAALFVRVCKAREVEITHVVVSEPESHARASFGVGDDDGDEEAAGETDGRGVGDADPAMDTDW